MYLMYYENEAGDKVYTMKVRRSGRRRMRARAAVCPAPARAREHRFGVRRVADRARRDSLDLLRRQSRSGAELREDVDCRQRAIEPLLGQLACLAAAGEDPDRLIDLIGPLPPSAERRLGIIGAPERTQPPFARGCAGVGFEDNEAEGVRPEVDHRQP